MTFFRPEGWVFIFLTPPNSTPQCIRWFHLDGGFDPIYSKIIKESYTDNQKNFVFSFFPDDTKFIYIATDEYYYKFSHTGETLYALDRWDLSRLHDWSGRLVDNEIIFAYPNKCKNII